ncbi:MAG: Calcium-binding component of the spindle pole body (SPB) half-bridge [Vezdaea aestivalis]|nr:MAG: Calcium-binding component of the spindle pole body (SPB) half-bridge [Vezdaea aestivalis]
MAQAFPSRSYGTGLGKHPDRSGNPSGGGGSGGGPFAQSAHARLDREKEGREALNELSEEQREEINEAFGLFDLDKDRHLSYHELKVALKALGFDLPKTEILQILSNHGVAPATARSSGQGQQQSGGGGGKGVSGAAGSSAQALANAPPPSRSLISLDAFQRVTAARIMARDPREEILRAFELFDDGGKGRIEIEDLRRVARELGEGLEEEELVAMIEEFDLDGDGGINREEFIGICMQ